MDHLDSTKEREELLKVFKEVERDIEVQFDFATCNILQRAVSLGCRALHFSGHGDDRGLLFENENQTGEGTFVDPKRLESLVRHTAREVGGGTSEDNKLDFVFVSACKSLAAGQAFAEAGVRHVVCLQKEVGDSVAVAFARAFYRELAQGSTVRTAFRSGNAAVQGSGPGCDAFRYIFKGRVLCEGDISTGIADAEDVRPFLLSPRVGKCSPYSSSSFSGSSSSFRDSDLPRRCRLVAPTGWRSSRSGIPPQCDDFTGRQVGV